MKTTFFLPAHPSYFDDKYSQSEIDQAISDLETFHGYYSSGQRHQKGRINHEFVFLREPGKSVTVHLDSAGLGAGQQYPESRKQASINHYRRLSNEDLKTHVQNLTNALESNRKLRG